MKALLVNKFYHPKIGGVETAVRQYAEALVKAGHEATVLCVSCSARACEAITVRYCDIQLHDTWRWSAVASLLH